MGNSNSTLDPEKEEIILALVDNNGFAHNDKSKEFVQDLETKYQDQIRVYNQVQKSISPKLKLSTDLTQLNPRLNDTDIPNNPELWMKSCVFQTSKQSCESLTFEAGNRCEWKKSNSKCEISVTYTDLLEKELDSYGDLSKIRANQIIKLINSGKSLLYPGSSSVNDIVSKFLYNPMIQKQFETYRRKLEARTDEERLLIVQMYTLPYIAVDQLDLLLYEYLKDMSGKNPFMLLLLPMSEKNSNIWNVDIGSKLVMWYFASKCHKEQAILNQNGVWKEMDSIYQLLLYTPLVFQAKIEALRKFFLSLNALRDSSRGYPGSLGGWVKSTVSALTLAFATTPEIDITEQLANPTDKPLSKLQVNQLARDISLISNPDNSITNVIDSTIENEEKNESASENEELSENDQKSLPPLLSEVSKTNTQKLKSTIKSTSVIPIPSASEKDIKKAMRKQIRRYGCLYGNKNPLTGKCE